MKKKFFSKLLMVALVATVGAFSSCKDYDDDIADVRNTINQTAKDLQTEYTNKISEVSSKVDKLQTSYDALSAALTEANTKLTALINSRFSEAVETAKAYSDANLVKAKDAAAAAESSAKAYADIQRVEAEKAALAAAQKEVAAAKAELQEALNKATETIATQGKSIEGLTKSCADLDAAVKAAQARANEAYALADKANTLAEQNKTALEKAAGDIAALQTALANLDGKVADKAEVAKIQSELNALKDQVDKNVVSLSDYNTAITKLTSDLGALKDDLTKQVGVLGESIAAVKLVADGNVAKIDGITTELSTLKEGNTQAHEQIIASINSLAQTVESNKSAAADALKAAIDGVMAELGAAKTLIENNDAAIRTLVDTKASELKALIDGNTAAIVKNAQDIQKNADAQKAENTLMNNAIAKNAQDIVAQGKDITKLDDAVKALKAALGDDTAATLKAYAESIAKSEALQAKLDAQGYSDAQDAAQNITIMEAIKQQAAQDAAAWKSAIDLAIENLVTTYKLASLNEYIKQTAEAAQTTAEQNAAVKAQQIADKALQDAKAYTDVLAQTLKDNYTTTTDMQTAIENAKKAAISQAYLDVLNTLLRDYDAWYSMNNENKMNLELTPTIIELTKAAVEKYGLTLSNAQDLVDKTIEAGLTKPEGTGTYDKDGKEIMTEPGVIMAEILAAADALQQEFTSKFDGLNGRIETIEKFLGATLGEGEAFKASVNAIIATSATASDVEALKKQIAGTEASGLLTKIDDATAQAKQNAVDVKKVMTTINNINQMFSDLFGGAEATSNVDQTALDKFEGNIKSLVERINGIKAITDNLDENVMELVNQNLAPVYEMITSINLYANQHQAQSDEMIIDGYTGYFKKGFDNFDHHLTFTFAVEQGKKDKAKWEFPTDYEFLGDYKVDGKFTFEDGLYRTYQDSILVRVNPVNADLSKATIGLLNSRGENIVDAGLVEVLGVKKYGAGEKNKVITRAATGNETGLWVIYFKLKDAKIESDFQKYAYAEFDTKVSPKTETIYQRQIVYAVAVKNSKDYSVEEKDAEGNNVSVNKERWIVSEYDLDLNQEQAARDDRFFVDNVIIDSIHNRYIQTEEGPNGTTIWTDDKKNVARTYRQELVWNNPCEDNLPAAETPSKKLLYETISDYYCACWYDVDGKWLGGDCESRDGYMTKQGYTDVIWDKENLGWIDENTDLCAWNAVNRLKHTIEDAGVRETSGIDNRHMKPFLEIDFGNEDEVTIPIDFLDYNECGNPTPIKGFYVTLDQDFALESNNSEINAWVNYEYVNVGYYKVNEGKKIEGSEVAAKLQEGNHGFIKILRKNNVKSDIIGFRVYAVNLDGTLYDPDGRAFYVKFGKNVINHDLSFDVLVENKDIDAKEVQDGTPNPIYAFNSDTNNDAKFFNIPVYSASYLPEYKYTVEYTWREDNPAIRGKDNSTALLWMQAGSYNKYTQNDDDVIYEGPQLGVDQIFNFEFSENENADKNDKTGNVDNKWSGFNGTGATPADIVPNEKTNSVRATIRKEYFNRLLDNATYKVRMTIRREDPQTSSMTVVNIIDIDITKRMPTGLPSAFSVKSLQLEGDALTFYMRPDTVVSDGINPWMITWSDYEQNLGADKIFDAAQAKFVDITEAQKWQRNRWAVDVRPYTMEEIFNGLIVKDPLTGADAVDENYFFEIAKAGSRVDADYDAQDDPLKFIAADNKHKDDVAIIRFGQDQTINSHSSTGANGDKPAYYLPKIHYSHLKDGKHEVKAGYVYRGISAVINPETGRFYNPVYTTRYGATSEMENQDLKINAVAFNADGTTAAGASKAQFAFECALDKALTLQEWSAKKGNNPTKVRFMTDIKYRKNIQQVVLTKWMTADKAYETVANAKSLVNGWYSGYTIANNAKLNNFDGYTLDHNHGWDYKFVTGGNGSDIAQGYFDAQFNTTKWKSLTELLADSVLKVVDLNPATIKFKELKDNKTAQQQPTGNALDYNVADYFEWYYADKDGNPVTQSSKIEGIGLKLTRTQLLPNLKKDVYGYITFPVVDVWNHERTNIKLYVRFLKPENQDASRSMR